MDVCGFGGSWVFFVPAKSKQHHIIIPSIELLTHLVDYNKEWAPGPMTPFGSPFS